MGGSILGNRVLRKEDPKFLTTGGVYVDDLLDEPALNGALHVTYARSSVAHGLITGIDYSDALLMPGVVAIFSGADLGLQPQPSAYNPMATRTLLAMDKVRYVGEPVVAIVTETREQGEDAAEAVIIDYDVLEAHVDLCAQRYSVLESRMTKVETILAGLAETVNKGNKTVITALVGATATIMAGLLSTIVVLIFQLG